MPPKCSLDGSQKKGRGWEGNFFFGTFLVFLNKNCVFVSMFRLPNCGRKRSIKQPTTKKARKGGVRYFFKKIPKQKSL